MLVARMRGTLRHLIHIGVGYLSLNRGVPTLSGGESQRVKMARQLDCDLCLDNVFIERLWRSLKYEAVYLHELSWPTGSRPSG